jgi:bacterioferritin (cytochrome b1)
MRHKGVTATVVTKPEPMDVPAVLESLNAALRLQNRSALQYMMIAGGSRGTHALAIGEQLWVYAQEEYADTRLVISKIVALGGEPQTDVAPVEYCRDIEEALKVLISMEEECLAALHKVIPDTGQEPGSEALEHLVEHLIMRKQNQVDFLIRAADV